MIRPPRIVEEWTEANSRQGDITITVDLGLSRIERASCRRAGDEAELRAFVPAHASKSISRTFEKHVARAS